MWIGLLLFLLISAYEISTGFDLSELWNKDIMYLILLNAIFTFLGYLCLLIGFEKGNASVGGIVLSSRVFASIPIGYFLIGEHYPIFTYLFIIVTLSGSVLTSWEAGMSFRAVVSLQAPGIRYFLATAFFWGMANVFIRKLDNELPTYIFLTVRQIIMLILALSFYKVGKTSFDKTSSTLNLKLIRKILFYVILLTIAQGLYVYSLGEDLTISEGIGVAEGTFTLIFSLFIAKFVSNKILNEPLDKITLFVRLIGMILAAIGTLGVIISAQ